MQASFLSSIIPARVSVCFRLPNVRTADSLLATAAAAGAALTAFVFSSYSALYLQAHCVLLRRYAGSKLKQNASFVLEIKLRQRKQMCSFHLPTITFSVYIEHLLSSAAVAQLMDLLEVAQCGTEIVGVFKM